MTEEKFTVLLEKIEAYWSVPRNRQKVFEEIKKVVEKDEGCTCPICR